jgi:hypothetical protein
LVFVYIEVVLSWSPAILCWPSKLQTSNSTSDE